MTNSQLKPVYIYLLETQNLYRLLYIEKVLMICEISSQSLKLQNKWSAYNLPQGQFAEKSIQWITLCPHTNTLILLHIPNGKRIWFWYKTVPAADASELRIRKQY